MTPTDTQTIEISFFRNNAGDLRVNSPGFGTGILDVLTKRYIEKTEMTGYDRFLLVWQAVAKQVRLARDLKIIK